MILSDYVTGTITLTNGSAAFTGTGTGWLAGGFQEGDTIFDITGATEFMGVIATITTDSAGTLTKNWEGPTITAPYRMRYQPDGSRVTAQARQLIELLGNGNLLSMAGLTWTGGQQIIALNGAGSAILIEKSELINGAFYNIQVADLAARAAYDAQPGPDGDTPGYAVFVSDVGDGRGAIYSKLSDTSADWSAPGYVTGPEGDPSTIPGIVWAGPYSGATLYAINEGVTYNGSSFRKLTTAAAGTAPSGATPPVDTTDWEVLAAKGANGAGIMTALIPGYAIAIDDTDPTQPIISYVSETSTSLIALQVADNSNVAVFLGDSIADTFDALTYVDVAGGVNLDTATAGVLKPTVGTDTYATSADPTLTGNSTGYGAYSTREVIPASALTVSGDKVRLTLTPPTTGNNTPIDDVWIGHAGTAPNFDGSQVRVTFSGGATGTTLVAGGASVVSDAVSYALDETKDLIVAFDFGATADARRNIAATGYNSYQKAVTSGESGNTTVTGYTGNPDFLAVIDKVEVRTAAAAANNMTVLSTILTAPIIPESMFAILLVKEVGGASVAGTDYTLDCSRDGGTTFAAMTLTEEFTLPNGLIAVRAAGIDVTGQPSNNTPRWRFKTLNNKNVEFHGVHFIWRLGSSP